MLAPLSDLVLRRGQRGRNSHAWLEVRGEIVDITADQFDEGASAVFLPRERTWHDAFVDGSAEVPDIHFERRPHYAADMEAAYVVLRGALSQG